MKLEIREAILDGRVHRRSIPIGGEGLDPVCVVDQEMWPCKAVFDALATIVQQPDNVPVVLSGAVLSVPELTAREDLEQGSATFAPPAHRLQRDGSYGPQDRRLGDRRGGMSGRRIRSLGRVPERRGGLTGDRRAFGDRRGRELKSDGAMGAAPADEGVVRLPVSVWRKMSGLLQPAAGRDLLSVEIGNGDPEAERPFLLRVTLGNAVYVAGAEGVVRIR